MWRIYSPNKKGVRIKTTIGKMILVLDQTRSTIGIGPIFGLVKYVNQQYIVNYLREIERGGSGKYFELLHDSLFYKRTEFAHENEVRFIIISSKPIPIDYIYLKVSPSSFIDEIALDPRLDCEEMNLYKNELQSINSNIPITQSNLYAFTPIQLNMEDTPMHIKNALVKYCKRHNL